MDVRVWGVVDDRLIEVRAEPLGGSAGIRIDGLPEGRTRTTRDRVRAALVNSALVPEFPPVTVRLAPAVRGPTTSDLDLPIALAVLVHAGVVRVDVRWILATGRLGLDGAVHAPDLPDRPTLADVVETLCRTRVLGSEHMFESFRT